MTCANSIEPKLPGWRRPVLVLLSTLAAVATGGCATGAPPRDVDWRSARIVADDATPRFIVDGLPGGTAGGVAVGAGTGGGVGVIVGVGACMATGPFFPLCIVTVMPTSLLIGAAGGAVVGAVRTESSAAIDTKAMAVKTALAAALSETPIAAEVRERLRSDYSLDVPLQRAPATGADSGKAEPPSGAGPLELLVSVTEAGTEGKNVFALRLVGAMVLRRGPSDVVWRTAREVQSDTQLTIDQWTASDSKALRGVLDACVRTAARRLAVELARGIPGSHESLARTGERYSSSCEDRPGDWLQAESQR
ncbi:MAG TPA: hypothetical protein VLD35_18075 [Caldimonas sp.]|nr:hypothetical protein [Caldimonas sp.]